MESNTVVEKVQSPMLANYFLSNVERFCDEVSTPDGAKAFLVKSQYREWANKSNRWKNEMRKLSNGNKLVDNENARQTKLIKAGVAPVARYKINKKEAAKIEKVTKAPVSASKPEDLAPIAAPSVSNNVNVNVNVEQEKKDVKKETVILTKVVTTGNTSINECNKSGVDSPAFKNTCKAFGIALVALGIYLGYKMYPNAKEQFVQAWDNGNPNKERLVALLKGVGACLLVVGLVGCGIYLVMHGFKQEEMENDNSFTYNILNASANIVNGIADYF